MSDEFSKYGVTLLVQPEAGAAPLVKAIHEAKRSVEIVIFRFEHRDIEAALSSAVNRGISVHALIAHVNGSGDDTLRKLEMRLLDKGVTVARTDDGLVRYHSKFLIIDRSELFVLGFNFTQRDLRRTRSFGVVTRNPRLVQEAVKLFDADTKRQPYEAGQPAFVVSPVNARAELAAFIGEAKSELLIYDPRIGDPDIIRLLEERSRNKVEVRIIGQVAKRTNGLLTRALKMRLHTRTMVRDRCMAFVGSQSLRTMELDGRREVGLVFRDPAAVVRLVETFEHDWERADPVQMGAATGRVPAAKLSKKIARAVSDDLPPMAPMLKQIVKDLGGDATQLAVDPEELEETVRDAVKQAVREAVLDVVEEAGQIQELKDVPVG